MVDPSSLGTQGSLSRPGGKAWWRLDTQRVLVILFLIALFAMSAREIVDPDFWWHLATGRYIVETRSIPHHDVFSYTATDHKWITHEWLTQIGMIGLYHLGGLTALLLATCAVVALTSYVVYVQCDARPHLAVFVALLGALASAPTWGPRPQLLNALLAAWFMYLLRRYRGGDRRTLWALPLSTVLWVNLHSGFFLGLFLVAVFLVGELLSNALDHRVEQTLSYRDIRDLALSLAACVMASLINPNTYKMLWYPFETLGSSAMQRYIQEWWPPNLGRYWYWPMAALLFGGTAVIIFTQRKRDLTDLMFFFGLGFASLLSARHIPLFAVAAVPIVTRYAARVQVGRLRWDLTNLPRPLPPARWMVTLNWILVFLAVVVGGVWVTNVAIENRDAEARSYPLDALAYVDESGLADQRMYNSYNWGGYLLWRGYKVYIDGRADVYLDDFMNEYNLAYMLLGDWRQPLDQFDVDYILIESGVSFESLLEESAEWTRVYRDDRAVIFVRAPVIAG